MPICLGPAIVHAEGKHPENKPHPNGGTLVWGVSIKPASINPVTTQYSISASLMELIFDPLIRINAQGDMIPGLASAWEVSPDGLVYTFYLRRGVRFHDGVECTAADAEFTYNQIIDPGNNSPVRSRLSAIKEFKALDKYTFAVTLREPMPSILFQLRQEIIPRHILQGKDLRRADFNYHPVGTGAFKFKSWDQEAGRVELAANEDYFEGRPYLDRVIVETYPDSLQLWSALMRHEVDLVDFMNESDYAVIEHDPAFKTYTVPWAMYYAILYNLNDPILSDRDVRRAIAYALDRKGMLAAFASGGMESVGPFHPSSPGFDSTVKPIEYDPVRARIELMHRGWKEAPADGILRKEGHKLEIRMLVDSRSEFPRRLAAVIRQQLSQLGIQVQILLYQSEDELTADYLAANRPQAWLRSFQGIGLDPSEAIWTWQSSTSEFARLWPYHNVQIDRLLEYCQTASNLGQRMDIYKAIHKLIYEEQPACFLFYPSTIFAVSAKFKNTDDYFSRHMPIYTIKDWYLEPGRNAESHSPVKRILNPKERR